MLPGVYYAKETVAGKGYKKNPNPIRVPLVNVNVNTTYTINAADEVCVKFLWGQKNK